MATDAVITLERLLCTRESDGSGHSEPYIWPVLLFISDDTLNTPQLVGVTIPAMDDTRVVIQSGMRAGQVANIPSSVKTFRVRFEDDLSIRRLILAVALWEEDETPEAAMRAGFRAFSGELQAAIADNLFALSQANEVALEALTEAIKQRVKGKVRSAIENQLTGFQKARVFLGTLNLDDIIDSAFKNFGDLTPNNFTLDFRSGTSNVYQIEGNLQTRPIVVTVERCQEEMDAVKKAQGVLKSIDAQIRQLQTELGNASPAEKRFIITEIRRIRAQELPAASKALETARTTLRLCQGQVAKP